MGEIKSQHNNQLVEFSLGLVPTVIILLLFFFWRKQQLDLGGVFTVPVYFFIVVMAGIFFFLSMIKKNQTWRIFGFIVGILAFVAEYLSGNITL